MSNLVLEIGGREYTVACAEGEEDHVRTLGAMIAHKAGEMGGAGQSEARQLLYAALLLADELHELRRAPAPSAPPAIDHTAALEALAERLEACAGELETHFRGP